jgi:plasmid stability protein
MRVMTVRDVPEDLMEFLRADALLHHRSVNKQVIVILEAYRARRLTEQTAQSAAPLSPNDSH